MMSTSNNYVEALEFAFVDLLRQVAMNLSMADLKKITSLLEQASANGNYEATFILGLYFDPGGCFFPEFDERVSQKSFAKAKALYEKAYVQATSACSPRSEAFSDYLSNMLNSNGGDMQRAPT
jgi:hypothetical protein